MFMRTKALSSLVLAGTVISCVATDARATAMAATGRFFNSVSGTASTSGGAFPYALTTPVPVPAFGLSTSTGVAPVGSAFSRALADTFFGTFVTATATGTAAAGPEQPFIDPIYPIASAASAELQTNGSYAGSMVTINGLATFTGGGVMEMAVLDTSGLDPMFLANLQTTHYSVERAIAGGYLDSSRVLGYWRETDVTNGSAFSFNVDIGSLDIQDVGFTTLTHAISAVPSPGALALGGLGLMVAARRRR